MTRVARALNAARKSSRAAISPPLAFRQRTPALTKFVVAETVVATHMSALVGPLLAPSH